MMPTRAWLPVTAAAVPFQRCQSPPHALAGQPEALLDKALDPSFRLWDAYGVLPVLCDPKRRGDTDACCVRYEHVKDIISLTKERCAFSHMIS